MPTIACKQDCNFGRLLSVNNTWFTVNITYFAKQVLKLIPPDIAPKCRNVFGKNLPTMNSSNDIISNISKQIELF